MDYRDNTVNAIPAQRYLQTPIETDLAEKMVLLSGPRQVGKTTLALALLGTTSPRHAEFLSWDDVQARPRIRRGEMPGDAPRIVLDEIHKYARWRNLVRDSGTAVQALSVGLVGRERFGSPVREPGGLASPEVLPLPRGH